MSNLFPYTDRIIKLFLINIQMNISQIILFTVLFRIIHPWLTEWFFFELIIRNQFYYALLFTVYYFIFYYVNLYLLFFLWYDISFLELLQCLPCEQLEYSGNQLNLIFPGINLFEYLNPHVEHPVNDKEDVG